MFDEVITSTNSVISARQTDDEIDRMVKARLDLPLVESLRQAGYTMAIIKKVYEMQLKYKKENFKSYNELRAACFILDQQVKLINGNKAISLVPQEWEKNYIEGKENSEQQPEPYQPQNSHLPRQNAETPKETDAAPCVLCLTTERQVACLPCGHLTSCVVCGHSLKTCPICRTTIKGFIRVYT